MASLDDILDSIDFDNLESPNESLNKKSTNATFDIDQLLNCVADEVFEAQEAPLDIDADLQMELIKSSKEPWLKCVAGVPENIRTKWTSYIDKDVFGNHLVHGKFKPSDSYLRWNPKHSKLEPHKILLEVVRKACVRCKFDDNKIRQILAALNSADGEVDDKLLSSFGILLAKQFRDDIVSDPNYDPAFFPDLATSLQFPST